MQQFKFKQLLWLYVFDVVINLSSHFYNLPVLEMVSKPLLMPILMVFVWGNSSRVNTSLVLLLEGALLFSWIGDVALLFDKEIPILFMVGLGGFMIAHIQYIFLFAKSAQKIQFTKGANSLVIALMFLYTGYLIFTLWPHLGELQIPVFIYATVLMVMGVMAVARKSLKGGMLVILGAIFFVASDSILAINKFVGHIEFGRILTMLTYTLAQGLIVLGIMKELWFTQSKP